MRRALLLAAACGHHEVDNRAADRLFDQIVIDSPHGMSGLAVDDRGLVWAVAERERTMIEVAIDHPDALRRYPIDGVPDGVDTEGLAYLGGDRFAISTEGARAATASVLYAERRGGRIVVTRERALTSRELGVELTVNHGGEGACGRGDDVIVAIETVGRLADGTRDAPLARLHGDALTVAKLRLTSDTGKISSLDCAIDASGTARGWAIERHYGVSRLLRFALAPDAGEVTPVLALDLAPVLHDALNLEGIVELPDGRLVAINDNQGSIVDGPTELLVFHPR